MIFLYLWPLSLLQKTLLFRMLLQFRLHKPRCLALYSRKNLRYPHLSSPSLDVRYRSSPFTANHLVIFYHPIIHLLQITKMIFYIRLKSALVYHSMRSPSPPSALFMSFGTVHFSHSFKSHPFRSHIISLMATHVRTSTASFSKSFSYHRFFLCFLLWSWVSHSYSLTCDSP